MSFSASGALRLTINSGDDFGGVETISVSIIFNGSTNKGSMFSKVLSGGFGQIDLTALQGDDGVTIDGTGLKIQAIAFWSKDSSNHNMTIVGASSNGFDIGSLTLAPGDRVLWLRNSTVPIDSTHKLINVTGTGTEKLNFAVVLG